MQKPTIVFLCILLTSFLPSREEAIKLDGRISKTEWAGAKEYELPSNGKLYTLQQGKDLYIGIKGTVPGWAHVYLHWKDSVKVLHASAALGAQLYTNEKNTWKLQQKFNWELRESEYGEALIQKQAAYYQKNGWCANTNNAGDKHTLEYKIDLSKFNNSTVKFAALFTADAKIISCYPAGLNDNTLLEELVAGGNPDNLRFNPQTWAVIK